MATTDSYKGQFNSLNPPDVIYIKPEKDEIVRWSAARMSGGIAYIRADKINEIIKEEEKK